MNYDKNKRVLDLSNKNLKKIPKQDAAQPICSLILDDNDIGNLQNIDSYCSLEKLSIKANRLLRMYSVGQLQYLTELNLSSNGIVAIEGLKELSHLTHLDLSANKIQTIDALKGNINLQLLNLSDNCVTDIPDISFLKDLKHLYLHGNRLTSLRQCEEYLPSMLESLTLARNRISDLNEISSLSNLNSLHHLTIYGNPCVHMSGKERFDYRPFVLNWCTSLKTIDGNPLDPIESLKAEWLYSQGRGRQFRVGEHDNLVKYLDSVCPLVGKALENDSDRKLRLILSKAQHHQRQLRDEISESVYSFNSLILSKKQLSTSKNSPKSSMFISCDGNISSSNSADKGDIDKKRMAKSATGNIDEISPKAQSTTLTKDTMCVMKMPQTSGETDNFVTTGSLITASKMVPVPETLMSPDVCPLSSKYGTTIRNAYEAKDIKEPYQTPKLVHKLDSGQKLETNMYELGNVTSTTKRALLESKQQTSQNIIEATVPDKSSSTKFDDCDEMFNSRMIKNIKDKAAQRNQQQQQQKTPEMKMLKAVQCPESSAVIIQKMWRGYNARKKNKSVAERLIEGRTQEYFKKLSEDVEATKAQLDTERRVQRLQMQAINALWKKISALNFTAHTKDAVSNTPNAIQSTYSLESDSNTAVLDLTRTCMLLGDQIQQLQESMRSVVNCITMICGVSPENVAKSENADVQRDTSSTQTEIVAVHTPISDMDLECLFQVRPSSLSLNENNK